MESVLVIYASKQGQTKKIAENIGAHLKQHGYRIDIKGIDDVTDEFEIKEYDGIIIGASVHASGYSKRLIKWIRSNRNGFSLRPTAFYSVCLGILQDSIQVKNEEEKIKQNLFDLTGWYPDLSTIFAGALTYSKYNWLLKFIMHRIAKKAGFETDMNKDYEYTDWKSVEKFADHFKFLIQPRNLRQDDELYACKEIT